MITNKFIQISLADCNHCICVSHIGKENTVLRASVECDRVSVIPNAVETSCFTPDPSQRNKSQGMNELLNIFYSAKINVIFEK